MSMEPPPPPPPPPGGYGQSADVNIGDALSYGWNTYWKNIGPMLAIAAVVLAIRIVFTALARAVDSTTGEILLEIAGTLVSLLVTLGWMRVALEITAGQRPEVADVFKAFGYGTFILATILFYIGTVIGFILLIVPGIIFIATFGFYGFVIAERGEGVGVFESLQRSADITRGHRWQLFGMALVLLLVNLVGLLVFIVGVIFTSGITLIAWAYTYRRLSNQPIEYAAWGI
jgi:uncharacterized membrane protein